MIATQTITLHNNVEIITQVEIGEKYFIPSEIVTFEGNIEECMRACPHLKLKEISLNENVI